MKVPHDQIPPETLQSLLEEYASRDGTDYGEQEVSLQSKVAQLRSQLQRGEIVIWFEPAEESVNLVPAADIPKDIE